MKISICVLLIYLTLCNSCTRPTQTEKDLRESLNKPLCLEMFKAVRQRNDLLTIDELRQQYQYLSVVYLENGCQPCYPKFIEWHHKMDSLVCPDNYSVLFVIQGDSYEAFMTEIHNLEHIEDHYYTIMDSEFEFIFQNDSIPRWIIHSSMLIDSESKIKMVGSPWVNEDMINLFYKTVSSE